MDYMDKLKSDRAYAAQRCDAIAFRMIMEGNTDAADALHTWTIQRDALDQQIAWMKRRTGWSWPIEPAWCN